MKILHINFSEKGGPGIGAERLSQGLRSKKINSELFYFSKFTKSKRTPYLQKIKSKIIWKIQILIKKILLKFIFNVGHKETMSFNLLSSLNLNKILEIKKPDIVHLHWIGNEMLSMKTISQIKKPLIWTMHDMWPFCGAEHFTNNNNFANGYKAQNKNLIRKKFNVNRFIWNLKYKFLKNKNIVILCPSEWIRKRAKKSIIFQKKKIFTFPNIINSNDWKILPKPYLKKKYLNNTKKKVLLFSATSSVNHRKGFNFLFDAIENYLDQDFYYLLVAGVKPNLFDSLNIEKKFLGEISSISEMNMIYNMTDIYILPSLIESFGQVFIEAGACGVPSVAFQNTAAEDVILHKSTGYLAKYKSSKDIANGINWCKKNLISKKIICNKIRKNTINKYSYQKKIPKMIKLYNEMIR